MYLGQRGDAQLRQRMMRNLTSSGEPCILASEEGAQLGQRMSRNFTSGEACTLANGRRTHLTQRRGVYLGEWKARCLTDEQLS